MTKYNRKDKLKFNHFVVLKVLSKRGSAILMLIATKWGLTLINKYLIIIFNEIQNLLIYYFKKGCTSISSIFIGIYLPY